MLRSMLSLSLSDLRISDDQRQLVQQSPEDGASAQSDKFSTGSAPQGAEKNTVVNYVGIAIDEPIRLTRLEGTNKISPLAAIGWTEADCRKWCEETIFCLRSIQSPRAAAAGSAIISPSISCANSEKHTRISGRFS